MALDKVVDVVMSFLDGDDIFLLLTSSSFSMMSITTLLDSECCVGFNNVADRVKSGCRLLSPDVLKIYNNTLQFTICPKKYTKYKIHKV